MLTYIYIFISLFFASSYDLTTETENSFAEMDSWDHYRGMQIFHQDILQLDSAPAMKKLDKYSSGTNTKKSIIASAWKGIYLQQKKLSSADSIIGLLKEAYSISEEANLHGWKAIFANYLGFSLLEYKEYQKAAEFLLLSDHLMESENYSKFFEPELYLYHIARMNFEFSKHEKSIEYLERALIFAKEGSRTQQFIHNLLGISNAELKNYKQASRFLEMVKKKVVSNDDSSGIAALNGNLGILYSYLEKYRKAKPLLMEAYQYNRAYSNWKSAATNLLWLAEVYLNEQKMDSAKYFLKTAHAVLNENKVEDIAASGLYYRTASHFYEKSKQYEKAFLYLDSTRYIENEIIENRDVSLLSDVNIKLISDKHRIEVQLLRKQKEQEAFIRNLIIVLSLLITLFLFYLWYSNYKKRQREKIFYQQEKQKTLAELDEFKNRIKSKNKMLENVKNQLSKMKSDNHEEEKAKLKMVQELTATVILTEEDWQKFKILFEKVYPDFLNKVQNEFPDLTTAEIRLLALLKLNLSVSEMANMLAILPESVRKTRQRLMKKLEISFHKELRNFIQDI